MKINIEGDKSLLEGVLLERHLGLLQLHISTKRKYPLALDGSYEVGSDVGLVFQIYNQDEDSEFTEQVTDVRIEIFPESGFEEWQLGAAALIGSRYGPSYIIYPTYDTLVETLYDYQQP